MRRDALRLVATGAVDHTKATRVSRQPKDAVVHLGDRVRRSAACLKKRALDGGKRVVWLASVVPDLGRVVAEDPDFFVIDNQRHHVVWRGFCACKRQRVDAGTIKQFRYPHALAVWLIEHKIAVDVAHGDSAWKVGVADLCKRRRVDVVDVAVWVGGDEDLYAVVHHADRPGARDAGADSSGRDDTCANAC